MNTIPVAFAFPVALHLLASTVWVGGMFFSLMVLRPCCLELDPPLRVQVMSGAVRRFFKWVWVVVAVLLATGYWMVATAFSGGIGWHVSAMLALGNLMAVLFLYAYLGPFRRLQKALASGSIAEAGQRLNSIRQLIQTNLALGIVLVLSGSLGRYLGH